MNTIILVGQATGTYKNSEVHKEFEGKILVTARPDGAVIVHNLAAGARPICYIAEGADVSVARNPVDLEAEMFVTTEDGQELNIKFSEMIAMQGLPSSHSQPEPQPQGV